MASALSWRLAPGQAGSKINGAVGLAALAHHMVVVAGAGWTEKGGLRAMSGSKGNTSLEALEASPPPTSTARSE